MFNVSEAADRLHPDDDLGFLPTREEARYMRDNPVVLDLDPDDPASEAFRDRHDAGESAADDLVDAELDFLTRARQRRYRAGVRRLQEQD